MIERRTFIAGLGATAAWPLAARGQQAAMPVLGFLRNTSPDPHLVEAFRQGLGEMGYVEGRNVAIEYRWTDQEERLPALAADLIERGVKLIATGGVVASQAAKQATASIPIVFETGDDPVNVGLVASLNRPGGNVTGVHILTSEVLAKRFELLREVVPKIATVAFLINPGYSYVESRIDEGRAAARSLGLRLVVLSANRANDFENAFATLVAEGAGALVINADAVFTGAHRQLVALAARHAIPTIYWLREAVEAGGLMSYGASFAEGYRQAGIYAGRILKGERPTDLPVVRSTRLELVINLKTAKALGLEPSADLLSIADEVIE
jgi:putative tryptophan/tyrosine transport system substrate-binding protein